MPESINLQMSTLESLITKILLYKRKHDFSILSDTKTQDELKLAKEIDYSIKSYEEFQEEVKTGKAHFISGSHGPKRLAVMLLNYYGESYCNNCEITIKADGPAAEKFQHNNTYLLTLKSKTHDVILPGNPTAKDEPYDFDALFIGQTTIYPDKAVDTSKHPWDSFNNKYTPPKRTLDFKSALWTSGKHSHNVNYIIKLGSDRSISLLLNNTQLEDKIFAIKVPKDNEQFYTKYFNLLADLELLSNLSWEQLIIN